jgi:hypothetical protein
MHYAYKTPTAFLRIIIIQFLRSLLSPELYLNQYKRQRRIRIEQQWMKTQMNI